MNTTTKTPTRTRWLGIGLIMLAVLVLLSFKAIQRSNYVAGLQVAETAGDATVPTLRAQSIGSSAEPDAAAQEADPFPSRPEAQVEWVVRNRRPAMVLFHSTTCKPCQAMEKAVAKVRPDFEAQVIFIDVVVTDPDNAGLLRQAQIRTIPTSIFVTAAGEAYGFVGAVEEDALRVELSKLMSGRS